MHRTFTSFWQVVVRSFLDQHLAYILSQSFKFSLIVSVLSLFATFIVRLQLRIYIRDMGSCTNKGQYTGTTDEYESSLNIPILRFVYCLWDCRDFPICPSKVKVLFVIGRNTFVKWHWKLKFPLGIIEQCIHA